MAAIGISYFITPSWFLDVRYAVSVSAHQTSNYNSTFSSPNPDAFGNTHSGTLVGNSSGGLIVHGLTFSINFVL